MLPDLHIDEEMTLRQRKEQCNQWPLSRRLGCQCGKILLLLLCELVRALAG